MGTRLGKDYELVIKSLGAISKTHYEAKLRKPKFRKCHFPFIAQINQGPDCIESINIILCILSWVFRFTSKDTDSGILFFLWCTIKTIQARLGILFYCKNFEIQLVGERVGIRVESSFKSRLISESPRFNWGNIRSPTFTRFVKKIAVDRVFKI